MKRACAINENRAWARARMFVRVRSFGAFDAFWLMEPLLLLCGLRRASVTPRLARQQRIAERKRARHAAANAKRNQSNAKMQFQLPVSLRLHALCAHWSRPKFPSLVHDRGQFFFFFFFFLFFFWLFPYPTPLTIDLQAR